MPKQHFGDEYGANAPENYERFFVPAIGLPLASDLVRHAGIRPGERVLDVACGTGVVARLAAEKVGSSGTVAGLDVNPGMLAVARSATPPGTRIEWHEGTAESLPMSDDVFDVVTCQISLQFVSDKPAALREMRRVLVSGGRIFVNSPQPTTFFGVLDEAMSRHISPEAGGFARAVFSLHNTDEIHQLMSDAGFRDVDVQVETKVLRLPAPTEFLWQYVQSTPLSGLVAKVDDEARAALEQEVVGQWQGYAENGGVSCALPIVIASARK